MVQPFWEKVWQFFVQLNIYLPHQHPELSQKCLFKNTDSIFTLNRQKLQTTKKIPPKKDKQIGIYSFSGRIFIQLHG